MKPWWILVALVAIPSEAAPRPAPRIPPLERNCVGPMAWDGVKKCVDTYEQGSTIAALSPDIKTVSTRSLRQYLYARFDDGWRLSYQMGDANYELVQRGTLMIGKRPAARIDLSHHVAIGKDGVFFERVSLVCPNAEVGCQAMVTACTVITRGRAVETFRGELRVADQSVTVVGDRSQSGSICRGR